MPSTRVRPVGSRGRRILLASGLVLMLSIAGSAVIWEHLSPGRALLATAQAAPRPPGAVLVDTHEDSGTWEEPPTVWVIYHLDPSWDWTTSCTWVFGRLLREGWRLDAQLRRVSQVAPFCARRVHHVSFPLTPPHGRSIGVDLAHARSFGGTWSVDYELEYSAGE